MSNYCNRTLGGKGLALLLILAAAMFGTACSDDRPPPGELAPGQEPYLRWCASCHGNRGEGKPPAFPPMADSEWLDLPDQALALIVLNGLRGEIEVAGRTYRGYMPPMQHLSDDDVAAIIGYIVTTWGGRDPALDVADVASLRQAFPGRQPPLEGLEGVERALEELP
jgi:mono/diheme cytochrome c family protein